MINDIGSFILGFTGGMTITTIFFLIIFWYHKMLIEEAKRE